MIYIYLNLFIAIELLWTREEKIKVFSFIWKLNKIFEKYITYTTRHEWKKTRERVVIVKRFIQTKMEVRSKTEQCGNDAAAAATTVAATVAVTTSMIHSVDMNTSIDAVNMDLSRTTVTDDTKPPLTRDESEYIFKHFFHWARAIAHFKFNIALKWIQFNMWPQCAFCIVLFIYLIMIAKANVFKS